MTATVDDLPRLDLAAGSVPLSVLEDTGFSSRRFFNAMIELLSRHDLPSSVDTEAVRHTLTIRDWMEVQSDGVIFCLNWGDGSQIYIALPRAVFAAMFERDFGGDVVAFGPVAPTALQRRFAMRLGRELAIAVSEGWNDKTVPQPVLARAAFESEGLEIDNRPYIAIGFRFIVAAQSLQLSAAFPADGLAAMRSSASPMVKMRPPRDDWRDRVRKRAGHIHLPVRSILARPEIGAARLLALRVGDMLPIAFSPSLPVLVGQHVFAHGRMGESNGCAAIRIEQFAKGSPS